MIEIFGFGLSFLGFSVLAGLWATLSILALQGLKKGKFRKGDDIKARITNDEAEMYLYTKNKRNTKYGNFYEKNLSKAFRRNTLLGNLGASLVPNPEEIERQLKLVGKDMTVEEFISIKVVALIAGASFLLTGFVMEFQTVLMVLGGLFLLIGFALEEQFFGDKVKKRDMQIERGLPNFLELLHSACVSGHTITEGIIKVSSKYQGLVAEEFNRAMIDFKGNGGDLKQALHLMAERNDNDALTNVVSDILIAYEKGDDQIISTLKAEAEMMRAIVSEEIEAAANKKSSTLILPMMGFFFVPLMAFILLPMFAQFMVMME